MATPRKTAEEQAIKEIPAGALTGLAAAIADLAPAEEAGGAEEGAASAAEADYPVHYYNARVPDERFKLRPDRFKFTRFFSGKFVAANAEQEAAVRAALRGHGAQKPDRWKGDDMDETWTCPGQGCVFATRNRKARDDHRGYRLHGRLAD